MSAADRKSRLRTALIDTAELAVAAEGLAGLKARSLALEVGCAVGAIYTVFDDLDELVLAVNARTLAALEAKLGATVPRKRVSRIARAERATERLVLLALAYLDFAATNERLWRALFEFRMPEGRDVPGWFVADRTRLFGYIERELRDLLPDLPGDQCAALARSLFSAVHGIVALGLEERLGVVSLEALRAQTRLVVEALARGLCALGVAGKV